MAKAAVAAAGDVARVLARSAAALEVLLDIERLLDSLGVYAYPGWEEAEILFGPLLRRHDVRITLLFPAEAVPPAESFARLLGAGIRVGIERARMEYHADEARLGHVYATSSGLVPDSAFRRTMSEIPIPEPVPVVLAHLSIPRRLVDAPLRAAARRLSAALDHTLIAAEENGTTDGGEEIP